MRSLGLVSIGYSVVSVSYDVVDFGTVCFALVTVFWAPLRLSIVECLSCRGNFQRLTAPPSLWQTDRLLNSVNIKTPPLLAAMTTIIHGASVIVARYTSWFLLKGDGWRVQRSASIMIFKQLGQFLHSSRSRLTARASHHPSMSGVARAMRLPW